MNYTAYEPAQSNQPDARQMMPNQFSGGGISIPNQQPHQLAGPMRHTNDPKDSMNVQLPKKIEQPPPKSKWPDISEYEEVWDWLYILIGALVVDVIVIFLVRYFPAIFGKSLNLWYNRFKLSAVLADVLVLVLGVGITRYIYSEFIYPTQDWNALYFILTSVVVQVVHDILFYVGIVRQVPYGHNGMIDIFKEYSQGGLKIVGGDALMMAGTSIFSMVFKAAPAHLTAFIGLLTLYTLPYILETRNNYSNLS